MENNKEILRIIFWGTILFTTSAFIGWNLFKILVCYAR